MILGFKTHIDGKPTFIKEKILAPYTKEQDRFRPKTYIIWYCNYKIEWVWQLYNEIKIMRTFSE